MVSVKDKKFVDFLAGYLVENYPVIAVPHRGWTTFLARKGQLDESSVYVSVDALMERDKPENKVIHLDFTYGDSKLISERIYDDLNKSDSILFNTFGRDNMRIQPIESVCPKFLNEKYDHQWQTFSIFIGYEDELA